MPRTVAEIDADIAEMNAALKEWLLGKSKTQVGYEGVATVQYGGDFVARPGLIRQRLAELQLERSAVTGDPTGLGPVRPVFGSRP